MKRSWLSLTMLPGLLVLALVGVKRAESFSYYSYGGYPVVWPGNGTLRYLSPGTFPAGSDTDLLILASMGQWSSSWGSNFAYSYYRLPQDPQYIDNYDGYSDTAAVPAEWLDPGVLAVTFMVSYGGQWYDMDLVFSDFPENTGWHMLADPNCEITANPQPDNGFSFYLVALHELGHCLGLGHDPIGNEPPGSAWFVSTMNPGYPAGGPIGNQNIVELHADERRAMRFLYPGTLVSRTDVGNAGYCAAGPALGKAVPAFLNPAAVRPGDPLVGWAAIENLGTAPLSNVRLGFYLSVDPNITPADIPLGHLLWNMPIHAKFGFGAAIAIPDLPAGTYYIGSILDDLGQITEVYEDNNQADYCAPLTVLQAPPAFGPFSQQIIECDEPFEGPLPIVTYPDNMAPITWSLDNPPPGMTVNPYFGVISWPNPIKSPFIYEIVLRATNGAGTSTQTLRLGVQQAAPTIVPIADHGAACGFDYVGPTPALTAPACVAPILGWSLVSGPPGMTINGASGVVSWPNATAAGGPFLVTIRAINAVGEATESWLLSIASAEGDLDANGVVDGTDLSLFAPCLRGPGVAPGAGCRCADFTLDGDVDLADFARLARAFSGS